MSDLKHWSRSALTNLKQEMDHLFEDLYGDLGLSGVPTPGGELSLALEEHCVVVRLPLPGFSPEDVSLSVDEKSLLLTGTREVAGAHGSKTTSFRRRVALPYRIEPNSATAEYQDGVLTIRLPRCQGPDCRSIAIRCD